MTLSFATFIARPEDARVPALILGVDGAEPASPDSRSGKLRKNRMNHPWVKRPDKTTRGRGLLFDSLAATWFLLVRAVYTCQSPMDWSGIAEPLVEVAVFTCGDHFFYPHIA